MSSAAPPSGTTRYLCPLECGWHHDRPPLPLPTHATTPIAPEAIQHMARVVLRQDAERVEAALREHLATHTAEQFVRVIHDLRAQVERLKRMAEPAPW